MRANDFFFFASLSLNLGALVSSTPLVNLRSLTHAPKGTWQHERRMQVMRHHQPVRTVWGYPENEAGYNFGDNIRADTLAALDHLIPKGDGDRDYWTCHVFSATLANPDKDAPVKRYSQILVQEFDKIFRGKYRNPIRNVDGSASVIVVAQITHPVDDRFFAFVQMVPMKPGLKLTMFEQAFPSFYGDKPSDGLQVSWRQQELFWDPNRAEEQMPDLKYLGRVKRLVAEENTALFDAEHGKIMQGVINAADNVTKAFPKFDAMMNRPQDFRDHLGQALVKDEEVSDEVAPKDQTSL